MGKLRPIFESIHTQIARNHVMTDKSSELAPWRQSSQRLFLHHQSLVHLTDEGGNAWIIYMDAIRKLLG